LCALSKKHYTMYAFGIIMRMWSYLWR
jgi:hypothetical protein